jgi:hypothetical protein
VRDDVHLEHSHAPSSHRRIRNGAGERLSDEPSPRTLSRNVRLPPCRTTSFRVPPRAGA